MASLITTTGGDPSRSVGSRPRPRSNGMPSARKYPLVTPRTFAANGASLPGTMPSLKNPYTMFVFDRGRFVAPPAAVTCGLLSRISITLVKNSARCAGSGYFARGSTTSIVITSVESKPGATEVSFQNVFTRSPAPVSNASDSASCAITMTDRQGRRELETVPLRPATIESVNARRVVRTAGARPKANAVTTVRSNAKPSTHTLIDTSASRGTLAGVSFTMASRAHNARSTPPADPAVARTRLSVSSCRRIRPPDAPSAARVAISPSLAAARPISRLATLTQAMSRTHPTVAINSVSTGLTSPTIDSFSETTLAPRLSYCLGC